MPEAQERQGLTSTITDGPPKVKRLVERFQSFRICHSERDKQSPNSAELWLALAGLPDYATKTAPVGRD